MFNIETKTWESVAIYGFHPEGRWGAAMSTLDSKLVVFGGSNLKGYCSSTLFSLETGKFSEN
jgi:hypothetical protein